MRIPVLAFGISLLIAAGFAAVGETVLRRRSRDPWGWNESFLVGLGVCAALLFPFSLVWPRQASNGILILLALCVIHRFAGRKRREGTGAIPNPRAPLQPAEIALLAAVGLVAAAFAALNFRYSYLWDGFQIWASKAQLLYHHGGLTRQWFPGDGYDARLLAYPPLVPLYEALVARIGLRFDFDAFKPVFLVFYASLLLSTYAAGRAALPRRLALSAVLLVTLLPAISTHTSAGGYADMPFGAFVAGAVAAALRRTPEDSTARSAFPWLVGSLSTVKPEGSVLALLATAGAVLFLLPGRRDPARIVRAFSRGFVVLAGFATVRLGYLAWLGIAETTYGPIDRAHLKRALILLGPVARLTGEVLANSSEWGLFWPAFLAAAGVLVLWSPDRRETWLAISTSAAIAAYAAIFLFTNWDVTLHVRQAYPRLLAQISPAAAVVLLLAYRRLRDRISRMDPSLKLAA